MRDRRIRGAAGRRPDPPRGAAAAGVPGLRLRGQSRSAPGPGSRSRKAKGRVRRPRRRPPGALQGRAGHRPHALGHPRRADGGERPPARRRDRRGSPSSTTASSRTPTSCAPSCSADGVEFVSQTDTEVLAHLVAKAFADGATDLEQAVRQALRSVDRRLRPGDHGRRAPRPHRRRPQRQPGAAGHRREGDVRRLRRRRAGRPHPPGRLPRRRRAGHDHRRRLPHLHDRRPLARRRARPRSTGTSSAPRSATTRTTCMQGDRRAAAVDRRGCSRPHRRALRHRPPRRAQPHGPRGPRDQARQDPRLRLGLLRGRPRRPAHRGPRPHARRRPSPRRSSATATRWSSRTRSTSRSASPARPSTRSPRCRSCSARAAG